MVNIFAVVNFNHKIKDHEKFFSVIGGRFLFIV